jgi:tRNA-splicing endonuclease subunit Sen34
MTNLIKFDVFSLNYHQEDCKLDINKNSFDENDDIYLIFDLDQSIKLRQTNLRLCGNSVSFQSNNSKTFVPMQLSNEEMGILLENMSINEYELNVYHSICFLNNDEKNEENLNKIILEYKKYLDQAQKDENDIIKKQRLDQMSSMKEKILDGKRKKLNIRLKDLDSLIEKNLNDNDRLKQLKNEKETILNQLNNIEQNFEKEFLDKNKSSFEQQQNFDLIKLFIETPEFYRDHFKLVKIPNESLLIKKTFYKSNQYKIYKYFWSLGYYLTCGSKFGGDYLVYPGDPSNFHSKFILVCLNSSDSKSLTLKQLITYARMATSVKKTFVIALCVNKNENSNFQIKDSMNNYDFKISLDDGLTDLYLTSINWSHI